MHRKVLERPTNILLSDVQRMGKIVSLGKEDTFVADLVNRSVFENAWAMYTLPG